MPKIQFTTPDGGTLELDLTTERVRVGRAEDNDFVIADGSVSSYHGEIINKGDGVELRDLGSTNGTHFDGARVEQAEVGPGQSFRLGNVTGYVEGEAVAEAPAEYEEAAAPEYEEEVVEAAAPAAPSRSWSQAPASSGAPVVTGLGSTPCPSGQRRGFGPKAKEKNAGGGLMALAFVGLAACGAAVFMILKMGA
ncbi:FHA domain-containing protein [Verrucomicrobium sp. BvORR106]|uniref:FHA domain-containing protein n=1 Tax=Verrucomicrobium sp. BvORR106 TaxID=1403819 RepID=UPI00056F5709|nr:FHA domain-containing protein [Verrucomicrobium sp. BvORR106]